MSAREAAAGGTQPFDVVVLGEVLLEIATDVPAAQGTPATLGVSGDALNVAAASAAAGARVGLVAVLTDDELGRSIATRVAELGVSTELLRFRRGQQGMYLLHCDPSGQREFSYARAGSVGSTLGPADLDRDVLAAAGAVVASGITCAISATARAAVLEAARLARRFVYDPNHRPRLASAEAAAADLREIAPRAFLVTPSSPGETAALLGAGTPTEAAAVLRGWGARNVAVTCGAEGVHVEGESLGSAHDGGAWVEAVPAPAVVDQTGAGDAFLGTVTARLVLGDGLLDAVRLGAAAASLVVGGRGGTSSLPSLEATRAHAGAAGTHLGKGSAAWSA
ncbi:PfkB family carbohydrate kinase [Sinomonas mesophila]|uniref:PfkB family carbohydrate kinase n=1 Tax=Sinomonas mesophila TaxID=1531955 RepID=UPI0009843D0B|nr:PfkB family carbohydrate kinase [Sinomonas mesophila]